MKLKIFKTACILAILSTSHIVTAGIVNINSIGNLLDGSGKIWDFNSSSFGLNVNNGTSDAYDRGVILYVNGTAFNSSTGDLVGNSLTTTNNISGFNIIRNDFVSSTDAFMRTMVTLTNTSGTANNLNLQYQTNTGADSNQQVLNTSSGDLAFTTDDKWITTDDNSLTAGDPTLNHILHGSGLTPNYVDLDVFNAAGTQGIEALFDYSFNIGESISFIFFNQQFTTSSQAATDIQKFNSNEALHNSGYLAGLTDVQLSKVVNWNFTTTDVPEPSTLAIFALGMIGLASRRLKKQA